MDNRLTKLNFAPGIKAKDVNHNFDVLAGWIGRERKTVGGVGLVDGFEITADLNSYTVSISPGLMINPDGDEVYVEEKTFSVGAPSFFKKTEHVIAPISGLIRLAAAPYSPTRRGHISYANNINGVSDLPSHDEFNIHCDNDDSRVYYLQIDDNKVYISKPEVWANKDLTVEYLTADDRVDAIILNPDGTYRYEKGITSNSPSHVTLDDYPEGCMLVGVVHWIIGNTIDVKFYLDHRSYRNIYVDDNRQLYINGKPYKQAQMIYFEPPEEPEENCIWYDVESNCLMIWREKFGDWGWVLMNDISTNIIREHKLWKPGDWPSDNQTFLFDEDEANLHFIPGTHALQIVIDNCVLMSDQYEEIVSTVDGIAPEYMSQGIGFKLKNPMDRPTYIDVTVTHQVRSKPVRETFQRAAIFIDENYVHMQKDNKSQVFSTHYPYVVGADQLEVWVDGNRLVPGLDFVEMISQSAIASESDKKAENIMCSYYKIMKPLKEGQLVNYRVSKYVWSYDQVAQLLGSTSEDLAELKRQCKALNTDLANTNAHVAKQLDILAKGLDSGTAGGVGNGYVPSGNVATALEKGSVKVEHLSTDARKHLLGNKMIDTALPATAMEPIPGVAINDFIQVHLISKNESRILIKNVDYTVDDTPDGLRIDLGQEFIVSGNTIYVTGFTIGA